ncbi:MAG: DUF4168 domain-containing protein, partial [Chromatocurvus sp.]
MFTQMLGAITETTVAAPRRMLPAVLMALALGTAGSAVAQPQQGGQGQSGGGYAPSQQKQFAEVTDQKLGQFMVAMASVQDVQEEYAGQIQSASDGEKAQELRRVAQSKMISAVEDSGLSVPQYNMIAERLRTDPEL